MKVRHWASLGETTFVAGIWLLYAAHRVAGRALFRLLLAPVVLLHWAARPLLRQASLQYLRRLHEAEPGVFPSEPGWRESLRHVACFADTLLDKLLAMAGRYPMDRVRHSGLDLIERELQAGRGGILITAHMGCLELCRAVARRQREQMRLTVLVHTKHAQAFNRILLRLDPGAQLNLLEVSDFGPGTAVQLQQIVDAGGWVAIAGDRVPLHSTQVARVNFLGHAAPFPVGAYVLASLLRCPLLLLACVHEGEGYRIHFERLADQVQLRRGQRAQDLARYAQQYAERLQLLLRLAPYDWFNFFPFWDQDHALA